MGLTQDHLSGAVRGVKAPSAGHNQTLFGLLPNMQRPRIAISLNNRKCFQRGLSVYRVSGFIRKSLLFGVSLLGPRFFPAKVLVSDNERSLAIEIARQIAPDTEIAAVFLGSSGNSNTVVLYLIGNETDGFAKIATQDRARCSVRNEAERLQMLAGNDRLDMRVPTVRDFSETESYSVLLTENASRKDLHPVRFDDRDVIKLQTQLNVAESFPGSFEDSALFERIDSRLSASDLPGTVMSAWRDVCGSLKGKKFNLGLSHGDFVPWNVFKDGNELVVVDWEWSTDRMLPMIDLAQFYFQGHLNLGWPLPTLGDETSRLYVYLKKLGIDPDLAPILFQAYLVDWITFEVVDGGKPLAHLERHMQALTNIRNSGAL